MRPPATATRLPLLRPSIQDTKAFINIYKKKMPYFTFISLSMQAHATVNPSHEKPRHLTSKSFCSCFNFGMQTLPILCMALCLASAMPNATSQISNTPCERHNSCLVL